MRTTILLFVISVVLVYGGLLFPQTLLIEQKIEINSSSTHISDYLHDLPKWEKWLDWQELGQTSNTKYRYSKFQQGVGAFVKVQEKNKEKAELYIQSISNSNLSHSELNKLKYIANFKTHQTHLEGEFELKSNFDTSKKNEYSTLNFTLKIDLGENPFVRYLAYFYYKSKIEQETHASLESLKKLCENSILHKN